MIPARKYYRPHELKARLAKAGIEVSMRTIYRWIQTGKLESAALPGGIRVPVRAVEELLASSQDGD